MLTLLASLGGFAASIFPDLLKYFRDREDKKHELQILQMQMKRDDQGHRHRLSEIEADADIAEMYSLGDRIKPMGLPFIDGLNASVRPVIAYCMFLLYAGIKLAIISFAWSNDIPLLEVVDTHGLPWLKTIEVSTAIWGQEDKAIFAAIIGFFYGQRAMMKVRQGK